MHKILIIDDEKPVRISIEKLGNWNKYHIDQILFAENGKEGLLTMNEVGPSIVFVDMQMPIMNGIEFLKESQKLDNADCSFIIISGYDDFKYAQQAIKYGVKDYLLKPVIADDLNKAIDTVMKEMYPDEDFEKEAPLGTTLSAEQVMTLIHDKIERDYNQSIRIQDFSDKYFFSKEYLSRIFQSKYDIGIYEYLTETRMKRAAELLRNPGISISDISERVGYSDNTYFSKAFHNYSKMTPSEYRRSTTL